ncbi:MAG TPA: flagellar biosynthetic protein FliO [Actinomycetota bacterium]|nr:flagellar biosynthetic protein FliO [Actinomycetota bacterium]
MDPFARLIIATLLICGAWFGVRHHSRRRRGDARRQLEMIARLGIAKGVSVTVVRIAGRGLVLGVSDKGVSLVAELSGQALDEVVAASGRAGIPAPDGLRPAPEPGLEPEPEPPHQTAELHRRAELETTRRSTHAAVGPRTGLVQRLQRMTLRTSLPATTGRSALRPVRGPVRAKKRT